MNEGGDAAALEAAGLAKSYFGGPAPLEVLRGVDLRVERGEMVAVVGASGSGKSTLLHLLGGLDHPTAGTVSIAGECLGDLSEEGRSRLRARSVGFVFQFHQLLPEFTALENVMLPGAIAGRSAGEARRRAMELLGEFGIADRADHKPGELSGGEQQRAAMARALHVGPAVLLADEPTGNLDRAAAMGLMDVLERYRSAQRQAIVIATHNPDVARNAGRVLSLEEGRLRPITMEWSRI
jgi:lipoprotein-releasing system ATP-binding protein